MARLLALELHRAELCTRMPFRYGIATMTRLPHVFLEVKLEIGGQVHAGMSADHLPPKWFTKDPSREPVEEISDMVNVIRQAMSTAQSLTAATPFDLWYELYQAQGAWARQSGLPPLLAHFGTSLVERAMLDAWARAHGQSWHVLLQADKLGVELGRIHAELAGHRAAEWLPAQPLATVLARHTVGLSDPLTNQEILPDDRVHDGLPQSLDDCIRSYGLRHFKLKVSGHADADIDRLERIVGLLGQYARSDWACSIDGNESFTEPAQFSLFLEKMNQRPGLAELERRTLFIEQPLHRSVALATDVGGLIKETRLNIPLIIDESDAELGSLPTALRLGYAGTSHKNCKGVFKGMANACRLAQLGRANPGQRFVMSGEDLSNVGPVALMQDLAVQAALGISSVERNGHHYFSGLSVWPATIQESVLQCHDDLYTRSSAGWPSLRIRDGQIALGSVNAAPLGVGFWPEVKPFTQLEYATA